MISKLLGEVNQEPSDKNVCQKFARHWRVAQFKNNNVNKLKVEVDFDHGAFVCNLGHIALDWALAPSQVLVPPR